MWPEESPSSRALTTMFGLWPSTSRSNAGRLDTRTPNITQLHFTMLSHFPYQSWQIHELEEDQAVAESCLFTWNGGVLLVQTD